MKNNILFFCLFFIHDIFFADDTHLFNLAEDKFSKEQWQDALYEYDKIQYKNSLVWEDIAICLFHLQQYPQALVAINRALIDPSFKQLNSLEILEKEIDKLLHIESRSGYSFLCRKILFFIPILFIQIIFLILLIAIFLILIRRSRWHDFTHQEKKSFKKILIILMFWIILWFLKTLSFMGDKAIVIKPNAHVYAGPEETFHTIKVLQPGIKVKIVSKQQNMYQIKTSEYLGWVNLDVLEPIINHE